MDDNSYGAIAACLENPQSLCEVIAQRPDGMADADLQHDRDRWITIDAILDMVDDRIADRTTHPSPWTTAMRARSPAGSHAPDPCSQENLVAALSLAMNEALAGSPRRLERFLPSDPTIEQLLQARGAATKMAKEPARLYLRFLYSAIITWAAAGNSIKWSLRQRPLTPLPKWRFARVREYVALHIEEPIRLGDLAKVAGLSRMHFAAQFRAYTGLSPGRFVLKQRIQRAQVLLGDARKTLAEVAFSVGFRNQAHFTTVFHRLVGDTPNCWRKALIRENAKAIR